MRWRLLLVGIMVLLLPLSASRAAESKWTPIFDLRLRVELTDSPSASREKDRSYSLGLVRARLGADFHWTDRLSIHGLVQAAAMTSLPANAAFGAGPVYRATNFDDRSPAQFGLAELSLSYRSPELTWAIGRLAFTEGAGQATGFVEPDFIRKRRLAERLVGNLDFPNVGRRFEGGTLTATRRDRGTLEIFALRPLAGAFHYEDAFEPLDVALFGGSWTTAPGAWVPRSSVRLFAIHYEDERTIATTAVGGAVEIDTAGLSLLLGDDRWSLLGWLALQRGEVGRREQSASAWILDGGYRFAATSGAPAIHLAIERASGDRGGPEDGGFFNLLPTNHKFYGALDYAAFSNLQDLSCEGRWTPVARWTVSAALHDLRLIETRGAWVGGSGAFSDREFGYVYRRPQGGRFESRALGRELDLAAAFQLRPNAVLRFEGGHFHAGTAARQILTVEGDGDWLSLEISLRR